MTGQKKAHAAAMTITTLLTLGALCAGTLAADLDKDEKEWLDEVRPIILKAEKETFEELEERADRDEFRKIFWARRDPSPASLANEYRQMFWERVQAANSLFLDSHKPGWTTDRGKIYILYGPPTETQSDVHLNTQGLPAAGRGLIRWIYEGRPGQRMDLEQAVARLPERARTVLVLYDIEGYSHAEIAEIAGMAVGSSKAQLHRARKLVREELNK